jgi:hypothetical protein
VAVGVGVGVATGVAVGVGPAIALNAHTATIPTKAQPNRARIIELLSSFGLRLATDSPQGALQPRPDEWQGYDRTGQA